MAKPTIRFKGYTDDWEQRKLKEILSFLKDGTHGTHADAVDGPLLLSAKNIKDGTIKWDESDRRISQDEYEKIHSKFYLKKGDVLLTIVGSIGETAILKDSEGITFQRSVAFLRPNEDISSDFLHAKIQTPTFQKNLESRKSTSAQPGIYLGDLAEIPVKYAPSLEEQIKIGKYFEEIDHLITLHQRKCEETKILKKYMLQKMFPQNGQKVPEIRFKGFTDDWEQRKLGELGEILTGSTPSTSNSAYYSEDGIPWVTPTDINELTISDTPRKLSEEGAKVGRVVPANTILCTCIASIGKNALLTVKGSFNQQINSLTPSAGNDAYFLLTESELWSNKMKRMAASGTMQIVNKTEFSELDTLVPSTDEQKKIGSYFRNLDHLITLHQRKCEELKNIKKFMLQTMFV